MAGTASGLREPGREARQNERDSYRLRRTTSTGVMTVNLVSAFAGDREMTEADHKLIRSYKKSRGDAFFSDVLYAISHQYFVPESSETLWRKILLHKHLISMKLGRNVGITVATLDYLSNITSELRMPTLISEAYVSEIAGLALRDGMTGLFNHSTFYELLKLELRNYRRYGVGVSLLLLDVDDFKLVNDRKGHQEGDRILVELAKTLTEEARDTDIPCRLGGDEFAIILGPTHDPQEACKIAERIRAKAATIVFDGQRIAISVGVAVCDRRNTSASALIQRADQALRKAKIDGKNQVNLAVSARPEISPRGQGINWRSPPIADPRPWRRSGPTS
jgi:diguanylate cyclase (GGDEF)-like protein